MKGSGIEDLGIEDSTSKDSVSEVSGVFATDNDWLGSIPSVDMVSIGCRSIEGGFTVGALGCAGFVITTFG